MLWMSVAVLAGDLVHQGRVLDSRGDALDGGYDLSFQLLDASGAAVGPQYTFPQTAVRFGYYTVHLEGVPDADLAQARQVEISVDGAPMGPAMPLADAPNAAAVGGQTLADLDARHRPMSVGSRPSTPDVGAMYFDVATRNVELWDGVEWRLVSTPPPVGEVITVLADTPPEGFLFMDGQVIDRATQPELAALVTHLQSLGLGSGTTATVPNFNDGRVLQGVSGPLGGGSLTNGSTGLDGSAAVTASGSTSIAMSQFDKQDLPRDGGSFSPGSAPTLSWPTYTVPSHRHGAAHFHSAGSLEAAIGSVGNDGLTLGFAAGNAHISNDCLYTVTGSSWSHGCTAGIRNHNTIVKGLTGPSTTDETGPWGGTTQRSGGAFSPGTLPSLSWPTYDLTYGGAVATGSTSVSGQVDLDVRSGSVRHAIRYR